MISEYAALETQARWMFSMYFESEIPVLRVNNVCLPSTTSSNSVEVLGASAAKQASNQLGLTSDIGTKKAELTWALHVVSTKGSFTAQERISAWFASMFPNNEIDNNMQLTCQPYQRILPRMLRRPSLLQTQAGGWSSIRQESNCFLRQVT